MRASLRIGALRRAYLADETTPHAVLTALTARFSDPNQDAVWISTISPEALAKRCATLEADPLAKDLPLYGIPFSVKDNIDVAVLRQQPLVLPMRSRRRSQPPLWPVPRRRVRFVSERPTLFNLPPAWSASARHMAYRKTRLMPTTFPEARPRGHPRKFF